MPLFETELLTLGQGQKRWEKAAVSGYENLRRLTHENFAPALERFSVLASRLRGLSRFHETSTSLGLETTQFDRIFDTLDCLQLLAHTLLLHANAELQQVIAFSAWLRHEIEIQGAGEASNGADHLEKDTVLDYPKILDYVQGALQASPLVDMFDMHTSMDGKRDWDILNEPGMIYLSYKAELRRRKDGKPSTRHAPGLPALTARLGQQCNAIFGRMAEMQKRKVRVGKPVKLEDRVPEHFDSRMLISV